MRHATTLRNTLLSLIVVLLLAACGAAPAEEAPTNSNQTQGQPDAADQTNSDNTAPIDINADASNADNAAADADIEADADDDAEPEAIVIVTRIVPTMTPLPSGALAIPGNAATLVAAETEDPFAELPFDQIVLHRSAGRDDSSTIDLTLRADGSYVRNGVEGSISPERINEIDDAIQDVNFFGMQALMLGPSAEDIAYRYRLTVQRGSQRRTINSQDGFMPEPYLQVLAQVLDVGLTNAQVQVNTTPTAADTGS